MTQPHGLVGKAYVGTFKILGIVLVLAIIALFLAGCGKSDAPQLTLADMANLHWWTVDRLLVGFVLLTIAIGMIRSSWRD